MSVAPKSRWSLQVLDVAGIAVQCPGWTQREIADYFGISRSQVGAVLWKARKQGLIGKRAIDRGLCRRSKLHWLPPERRGEYGKLRRHFGVAEAVRIMKADMEKCRRTQSC